MKNYFPFPSIFLQIFILYFLIISSWSQDDEGDGTGNGDGDGGNGDGDGGNGDGDGDITDPPIEDSTTGTPVRDFTPDIQQLNNLITNLQTTVDTLQTSLTKRVTDMETMVSGLSDQVTAIGAQAAGANITAISQNLQNSIQQTSTRLTGSIKRLESGKVQKLLNFNELWRINFRVVNATLIRLRNAVRARPKIRIG